MAERVLSWGELNRALLARQLLLERSELAPAKAVERVGGLQTQYARPATWGCGPDSSASGVRTSRLR
ncbi:MAG TPA: hypothetical protein VGO23_09895 [Pseudonocardia sp.]|nr:hypothetical protein [Pseudonocardia sp.]